MGNKIGLLLLITILSVSMLTSAASATVEPMSKTPTPELSVKYVDNSYDIPATTTIDPFTGKTEIIPARHINNQTMIVTIKNQTVTYRDDHQLIYLLQMKGHYTNEWTNITSIDANPHSEYTIWNYAIDGNNPSVDFTGNIHEIVTGDTADFRVQALIRSSFGNPYQMKMYGISSMSDWSDTQTVTITAAFVPNSPNPEASETAMSTPVSTFTAAVNDSLSGNQQLTMLAIATAVIALALAVISLLVYVRKIKNGSKQLPKQ
jgi:hypothetical protein